MKTGIDRWSFFYHLPRNSVDVIFLGNSHNFTAFQPKIIDSIIPIKSYVLGIDAENVIISYYELKEVLKTQHPEVVVLETYALELDDTKKMGFIFEFIDAGFWDVNKFAIAARYLSLNDCYSLFPVLRSRLKWGDIGYYLKNFYEQANALFSSTVSEDRGVLSQTQAIVDFGEVVNGIEVNKKYRDPSPDIEFYLYKLYRLCQENNIRLVLVTSPILKQRMVEPETYAPYDETSFVTENDIPVITFPEDQFNLLHFYNPGHVNVMGSTIVSIQAAEALSRIMDLPINQDALAQYQAFVFKGYSMVKKDGHYSVDLLPANADVPLEYQWKLFNADNGQTLFQSEWSTHSTAEFDINEDAGLIDLVYEIRNPAGGDTLGVSFPLNEGK
jgi:hypothetical protein